MGVFRILYSGAPPVVPSTNTAVAVVTLPLPTPIPLVPIPAPVIPTTTSPPPTPANSPATASTSAATPTPPMTSTAGPQPSSVATSADTAAPSPTLSSIWRAGDIVAQARLVNVGDASFDLGLTLTNEGANNSNARFRMEDATAKDDTGEAYASGSQAGQRTDSIEPNNPETTHSSSSAL